MYRACLYSYGSLISLVHPHRKTVTIIVFDTIVVGQNRMLIFHTVLETNK